MKNLFGAAILSMIVILFTGEAFAQKPKSKDELLKEIATLVNTKKPEEMSKAYQLGKEYLTRFGKETNNSVTKVRTFVDGYRENSFFKAIDDKKFSEAFLTGKEILTDQPDNVDVSLSLAYAGYGAVTASNDKSFVDDATIYARKTIELLGAGKTPKSFAPFTNKDEALAWMHYLDGFFSADKDKRGSAVSLYNSTRFESSIKETSQPYYLIAMYYESVYETTSGDLKAKLAAKTISDPDAAVQSAKIAKVLDLMMDAYARAVKRAEAENAPNKVVIKDRLTQVHKFVKKTDVGVAEYINYINKTEMPDPGKF